jgi:hypothetical protein
MLCCKSVSINVTLMRVFSQIPVIDKSGRIIGVFTWQSFGQRVADLYATTIKPMDLPIREAMEPARFIGPEVYNRVANTQFARATCSTQICTRTSASVLTRMGARAWYSFRTSA